MDSKTVKRWGICKMSLYPKKVEHHSKFVHQEWIGSLWFYYCLIATSLINSKPRKSTKPNTMSPQG